MAEQVERLFKRSFTIRPQIILMIIFLVFHQRATLAVQPWLKQDLLRTYVKIDISSDVAKHYVNAMCNSLDEQEFPIIDTEQMKGFLQRTLMTGTIPLGRSAKELYGVFDIDILLLFAQLRRDKKSLSRKQAEHFVFETLIRLHSVYVTMGRLGISWRER